MTTARPMLRTEEYGQRGTLKSTRIVGGLTRSRSFVGFSYSWRWNVCIGCQLYSVYPKTRGRDTGFGFWAGRLPALVRSKMLCVCYSRSHPRSCEWREVVPEGRLLPSRSMGQPGIITGPDYFLLYPNVCCVISLLPPGLLLLSSSCYCLSVELVNELGRIVVLPHPDGLEKINSDRADARGLTVSGSGMLLHRGQQLSACPLELLPPSCIPQ